jgi:hypothetical protein
MLRSIVVVFARLNSDCESVIPITTGDNGYFVSLFAPPMIACAAARRAMGIRYGEQLT